MSRTVMILAAVALIPLVVSAQSQPVQDALLDRLIGTWVLHGTIDGKQTTHDVTFDWVLGHQYVQLHEVSREKDVAGHAAYEAIVFIGRDEPSSGYACLWLDSTGGGGLAPQAIGLAKRGADDLAFVFKLKGGAAFYTTFAYSKATDVWQWRMDGEESGKRQPFARVTLTRR